MHRMKAAFKKRNLKITPQRMLIYNLLLDNKDHPSADVIYKLVKQKHPHISFDTVHRTLITFADIGLLRIVEGYGDSKRFDPELNNHHHMRCMKCGSIADFYNKSYVNIDVPHGIHRQFQVINKKVVLEGYCQKCNK
ncbi:MAG: Fur family transcriptional regulator [bacterium]